MRTEDQAMRRKKTGRSKTEVDTHLQSDGHSGSGLWIAGGNSPYFTDRKAEIQ